MRKYNAYSYFRSSRVPAILSFALLSLATTIHATLIEDFQSTGTAANWSGFTESTSDSVSTASVAGVAGNAVQLNYNMNAGKFTGLTNDLAGINFGNEGANALRFHYRATGLTNTLEFKFTDADSTNTATGDQLDYKLVFTPDNVWHEVVVPFTEFKTFQTSNGVFKFQSVGRMAIGVTRDNGTTGSGTVYLDNVQLYKQTSLQTLIDTFETADFKNNRSETVVPFAGGTGSQNVVYVTTQTVTGSRGIALNYAVPASGFSGFEEPVGGILAPTGGETLDFYAKGTAGGEPLTIEIQDNSTTILQSVSGLTTSFRKFSIPLSNFTGLNAQAIRKVKFVMHDNAGTGTIFFDDIAIGSTASETAVVRTIEDFSLPQSQLPFSTAFHTAASGALSFVKDTTVPGSLEDNRVAQFDYEFKATTETPYAIFERELRPNLFAEPVLKFFFKGSGANDNLEVKLTDTDGTVYLKRFTGVTNTNGVWRSFAIPVEEFSELNAAGTDSALNLRGIKSITWVATVGTKGAGSFTIDTVESTQKIAFEKPDVGATLLKVSTPNNPFSPNGDGVADTAKFNYTLGQTAGVKLTIYDLRGVPVREFSLGDQLAGDHVIEWDGGDDDGRRVTNGLYLFRLEANGLGGGHDRFKEIIGVVR